MCDSTPSNMANFTTNSYNLESSGNSWCTAPGSIYTNPQANFGYFNSKCGDPYTYYSYWYRRFPNQTNYLNCYYLPYKDKMLYNRRGYIQNPRKKCKVSVGGYNQVSNGFKFYDRIIVPKAYSVGLN